MKKISAVHIVFWSLFAALGIAGIILGALVKFPVWLIWLTSLAFFGTDIVWIILVLVRSRPRKVKGKSSYTGDQAVLERIGRDAENAVARYRKNLSSASLLKKRVVYQRPWFLLCGQSQSGKSSLLKGCGLHFPVTYPSEADGLMVQGSEQVQWYFANEAVWIDTPGTYTRDDRRDEWQALAVSLAKVRPVRPIDGLAVVVNAQEVLDTDDNGIKTLARRFRQRIDEVISLWGIEFPVYLLFNHTDEIPGFNEYFSDYDAGSSNQILGATIPVEKQRMMPRVAFAEEFNLLSKTLTNLRIEKLHNEKRGENKRMVCRFSIHFDSMQEKLGALITELFKPSSYIGKPIFRGFYFTSCRSKDDGVERVSPQKAEVGMTIINHPLNPKKMLDKKDARDSQSDKKNVVISMFVLPLFRKIMVRDTSLVKTTSKRSQLEFLRHYAFVGVIAVVAVVLGIFMKMQRDQSAGLMNEIQKDASTIVTMDGQNLSARYARLDLLRENIVHLQNQSRKITASGKLFGFYKGRQLLEELKAAYQKRAHALLVIPAAKYLEYRLRSTANDYGELDGESYSDLYDALKTYLSISEAVASNPRDIDTVFLRASMIDAIKRALMNATKRSRLPKQVETILQNNLGLYLQMLKKQEHHPIQENQRLVVAARRRLQRLPSAQNLYETVINRIKTEVPSLTLDKILERQGEGLLKSEQAISRVYTQEGWNHFVSDAITDAGSDPFKIDWVIGLTEDQVPESMLDKKKLRNDMILAYCEDTKNRWLAFLSSVTIEPFGDLSRCSRMLQKLAGDQSEVRTLLEAVAEYSFIKQESEGGGEGKKILDGASKLRATKKYAKKAEKASDAASSFSFGSRRGPFESLIEALDPLRAFARSSKGALSGFQGYSDRLLSLVEKLELVKEQGEDKAISIFDGSEDDPLLSSWRSTGNELGTMPVEIAEAIRPLLLLPVTYTGRAASEVLTKVLNSRWQSEIVKPFTSRFSGHYPFSQKGDDASFEDVMEFFRPSTGAFWGFHERILSSYLVKTSSGWMVRSLGSLELGFNPMLATTLSQAERIRDVFFKQDGTLRTMSITFSPSSFNKQSAKLEVNGQVFDLQPGGSSVRLNWPVESPTQQASLKVIVDEDFTQDIVFNGPWGFMKLISAARINTINASAFMAKWQVNVQNTYVIQQNYRVQVGGADHPFEKDLFADFDCPTELVFLKESDAQE
ncbi:MAG: type VI secretion system membrane subunit TssM [Chitinivibrionales bacterium]|nr:type VI secretion system membrane subunit TssM [Chitinivibrionales bacterium]